MVLQEYSDPYGSYHGDQPRNLNQSAEYLLELSHNLPDCLLILPEPLMSSHAIYRRLEELYKEDRIARFVIDEVDKFLDVRESASFPSRYS